MQRRAEPPLLPRQQGGSGGSGGIRPPALSRACLCRTRLELPLRLQSWPPARPPARPREPSSLQPAVPRVQGVDQLPDDLLTRILGALSLR